MSGAETHSAPLRCQVKPTCSTLLSLFVRKLRCRVISRNGRAIRRSGHFHIAEQYDCISVMQLGGQLVSRSLRGRSDGRSIVKKMLESPEGVLTFGQSCHSVVVASNVSQRYAIVG